MKKVRVNFYRAEVKYRGSLEDYTIEELFDMAKGKIDKGIDPFDHYEDLDEEEALELDGCVDVACDYWSNKLAVIEWSYIDETPADEEAANDEVD